MLWYLYRYSLLLSKNNHILGSFDEDDEDDGLYNAGTWVHFARQSAGIFRLLQMGMP